MSQGIYRDKEFDLKTSWVILAVRLPIKNRNSMTTRIKLKAINNDWQEKSKTLIKLKMKYNNSEN